MARKLSLSVLADLDGEMHKALSRSFQSGHVNFLLGSGASVPAIPLAGNVEQEIDEMIAAGQLDDALLRSHDFINTVQGPVNKLLKGKSDSKIDSAVQNYSELLGALDLLLTERKTSLLPKQATIFTTNYDLFIERAAASHPGLRISDGFSRPHSFDGRRVFTPRTFFDSTFNSGNLYNYKVEVPSVNLIKLHGSLSWRKADGDIEFAAKSIDPLPAKASVSEVEKRLQEYAVILPQASKFRTTLMESTYYELLRIFANELDRENALLISYGFSFADKHIAQITKRALQNPTLRVLIFAFDAAAGDGFLNTFEAHANVLVFAPGVGHQIPFSMFNEVLRGLVPKGGIT